MSMLNQITEKHSDLFQSVAIFPSWLLMIYAGIFFIPASFLLFAQEQILGVSTLATLAGLFVLGFVTAREKSWNYIGWGVLTITLIYLMFSIPHGVQLIYLVLAAGLIGLASYLGFADKKTPMSHASVMIAGIVFLLIFASHAALLSNPRIFGLNVEGNEFPTFTVEAIQKVANMDPVEFVKTDEGRKIAVQAYDTSIFISEEDLEDLVRENPAPIEEVQQSLLSTDPFADNPYGYIMSIYTHSFINYLTE